MRIPIDGMCSKESGMDRRRMFTGAASLRLYRRADKAGRVRRTKQPPRVKPQRQFRHLSTPTSPVEGRVAADEGWHSTLWFRVWTGFRTLRHDEQNSRRLLR